jgi:hypothetical protein
MFGFGGPGVRLEIIDRNIDGLAAPYLLEMVNEQLGLQRVGMIEIDLAAFFVGEMAQVSVICIVRDIGNVLRADAIQNLVGYRRLP